MSAPNLYKSDQKSPRKPVNHKAGFRRLTIAIYIPYLLAWVLFGVSSCLEYSYNQKMLRGVPAGVPGSTNDNLRIMYGQGVATQTDHIISSVFFGAVAPAILAIIGLISFWVYRGFKPKA